MTSQKTIATQEHCHCIFTISYIHR